MKQSMIKYNVGENERKYRFAIGILASLAAFNLENPKLKLGLGALGLVEIATAVSRYSPMNHLLGVNRYQMARRVFPHLLRRL